MSRYEPCPGQCASFPFTQELNSVLCCQLQLTSVLHANCTAEMQHQADESQAAAATAKNKQAGSRSMHLGDDDDPPYDPCTEDYTEVYLNRLDVRTGIGEEFTATVLIGRLSGTLCLTSVELQSCGTSMLL